MTAPLWLLLTLCFLAGSVVGALACFFCIVAAVSKLAGEEDKDAREIAFFQRVYRERER